MKSYDFNDVYNISKEGIDKTISYLKSLPNTLNVYNVEDYSFYRDLDIDLVWILQINGEILLKTIEVKTDRYFHTGNYFFETISNEQNKSKGCLLYSKSDYLFYFFTKVDELHIFNTKEINIWFNENFKKFKTKHTSTKSAYGDVMYTSTGKIVPRFIVKREFSSLKIVNLKN